LTGIFISDYGFCQDRIYARSRLSPEDYRAYDEVARRLEPLVQPAEVIVCLDACVETLLDRIARRGRAYERVFDRTFLEAMREAYAPGVSFAETNVIRVDCDRVDLREAPNRVLVIAQISSVLERE
jgi:deoxyadenosine/deoxycytidine kinase